MNGEPEEENLNKSEISQVFEIALKRNLPVNFEVSVTLLLIYTRLCLQCVKVIAPRHCLLLSVIILKKKQKKPLLFVSLYP